jgi:hypothetical protein
VYTVADDAAGRVFRCKVCGKTFRVPDAADEDEDLSRSAPPRRRSSRDDDDDVDLPRSAPPRRRSSREDDDDEDDDRRPRRNKKKKKGATARFKEKSFLPAIFLYIVTGLALLWTSFNILTALAQPGAGKVPAEMRGEMNEGAFAAGFYGGMICFPLINILVLYGAYCLQTARNYGMAYFGCILASIPCCSPCVVLGMPFGIWGIVLLASEDGKRAFS